MKLKHTIVALILVVAFGSYIYFFERKKPTTDQWKEKTKKVFDLKSEDIDKISINKAEENIFILCEKRSKYHWQMKSPIEGRADKSEIETILSKIEFLSKERTIKREKEAPINYSEYGLKSPRINLSLWKAAIKYDLLIGDNTVIGDNIYVKRKDVEDVYVVSRSLYEILNKKVEDLRDRKVVYLDKYKVNKIEIKQKDKIIVLVKKDDKWMIEKPKLIEADGDKVDELLSDIANLDTEKFIDNPSSLSKYGLAEPQVRITLTLEDEWEKTLLVGNKNKKLIFLKRDDEDIVLGVNKDFYQTIMKEYLHYLPKKEEEKKKNKDEE